MYAETRHRRTLEAAIATVIGIPLQDLLPSAVLASAAGSLSPDRDETAAPTRQRPGPVWLAASHSTIKTAR